MRVYLEEEFSFLGFVLFLKNKNRQSIESRYKFNYKLFRYASQPDILYSKADFSGSADL